MNPPDSRSSRPRLLFVSTRPARDTTSGPLILHRHLAHIAPRFEISRAHLDPPLPNDAPYTRLKPSLLYSRLRPHRRWGRWIEALDVTVGCALSRRQLSSLVRKHRPDLILTVAEPPVLLPLTAIARSCRVPLVTIVHDWSPVWLNLPGKIRPLAGRRFVADCRAATLTLNVSAELAERFGGGPRQRLLPPVPALNPRPAAPPPERFHALYAGIFHYFHGTEMIALCTELTRRRRSDLLRIIGLEPDWANPDMALVKTSGFHRGFLPRADVASAFDAAGALLIICPFAQNLDAFSRYSFPSKLTEYSQHGRPLILWAPKHAAAVTWARRHDAALVVTDPDPSAVADALLRLEADPALRSPLTTSAESVATTFSPAALNARFEESLWDALATRKLPSR